MLIGSCSTWHSYGGNPATFVFRGLVPGHTISVVFGLDGKFRLEEEHVEEAAPQAEQEGPLQDPEGEALSGEGGVGGESPLPDAGPKQVEVVEGIDGEPKEELFGFARDLRSLRGVTRVRVVPDGFFDRALAGNAPAVADAANADPEPDEPPVNAAWKMAHDLGALISTARGALDDLQVAACHAIDNGNAREGRLVVKESDDTGTVTAEVQWPYFGYENRNLAARFCVEGKLLKVEE